MVCVPALKMKINKKELEFVIESWEGHIRNNTNCGDCKSMSTKCPVNKFFKKLKRELKQYKKVTTKERIEMAVNFFR